VNNYLILQYARLIFGLCPPAAFSPWSVRTRALASSYLDSAEGERPGGGPVSLKLLRDVPFGAVLCLVGTNYINSANAQQTDQQTIVTKAEAALAAKIKCEDFRKNTNGTWTSAPNTKIEQRLSPTHL